MQVINQMIRSLIKKWKKGIDTTLVIGLAISITFGLPLATGCRSDVVSAQEIAINSTEVQDTLSGEVKVAAFEESDGKALVICTDIEGNSYVVVEIDLNNKDVTKLTYPAVGEPYLPYPQMEGEIIQTTTDKLVYDLGEEIAIDMTNISNKNISGGGVYFSIYSIDGYLLAGNGLFLAFDWQPGEGFSSFTWDQASDNNEQVELGTYVILGEAGDYSDAAIVSIN